MEDCTGGILIIILLMAAMIIFCLYDLWSLQKSMKQYEELIKKLFRDKKKQNV